MRQREEKIRPENSGVEKKRCGFFRPARQDALGYGLDKTSTRDYLVAGLKRVYKQGRSAFKTARKSAPENLREYSAEKLVTGCGFEVD